MNANADDRKKYGVYINSMLSKKVVLSIVEIGKNLKYNLEKKLSTVLRADVLPRGLFVPKPLRLYRTRAEL